VVKCKGFTIIELLVVISVIAILIGVAYPRFKGMQDEANISKAKAELSTMQAAVESYNLHQQAYPGTTTTICVTNLNTASPLIISDVLYDPFSAVVREYRYILADMGAYYVIFSVGVDGGADITGITDAGALGGVNDDDIFITNGTGF